MPPKKDPKKGGGEDGADKESIRRTKDATMAMFHQLDQDKISTLETRLHDIQKEKDELQRARDKGEKDTHEFVAYFQKELEAKDIIIAKRNEELALQEKTLKDELHSLRTDKEGELERLTERSAQTELGLRGRVEVLEEENNKLESFKEDKAKIEAEMKELREQIKQLEESHKTELAAQERKFLEEKVKMAKEMEDRTEELRQEAHIQVQNGLDADTRKVIADNRRMKEELRFQQEVTAELQAEKARVDQENKLLRRDLDLANDKESEYAAKSNSKSKEIQNLRDKITALENLMKDHGKKFQAEMVRSTKGIKKDLEEQTLDAAGLRQLLKLKNRELQHIKTHARTILEQRTEVETFFLDALEQCKQEISEERQRKYRAELNEYRQQMAAATKKAQAGGPGASAAFPKIKGKTGADALMFDQEPETNLPLNPSTKVRLDDLTWVDRDRVLRLLFAKINSVQGKVSSLPSHTLEPHAPGRSLAGSATVNSSIM